MAAKWLNNLPRSPRSDVQRRKARRRFHSKLECNLGPMLDLSPSGMRVITTRGYTGRIEVTLRGPGIEQVLRARVAWSKKHGFRTYELGLEFVQDEGLHHLLLWISDWCE